jgi:hypothetical protein
MEANPINTYRLVIHHETGTTKWLIISAHLKQQNETDGEIIYIFKVLFLRHMKLYLSYTLSFMNLINIYCVL